MKDRNLTQSIAVTDASFDQEVMQSDVPVLIDFWAEWCLPCREVDREMAAILAEADDVALRKIDVVDWQSAVAQRYLRRTSALPYVLVFNKNGKRIAVVEGLDLKRLRRAIEKGRGAPLPVRLEGER